MEHKKNRCRECAGFTGCGKTKDPNDSACGDFVRSIPAKQEAENPKEACGAIKPTMANISAAVLAEVGVGMHEGARKYGSHNYRVTNIFTSTYHAAMLRHLFAYWEGEDIDPDSGVPHISKLIACAAVLRDADIQGMLVDDRPPKTPAWHKDFVQKLMDDVMERHPECVPAFTELNQKKEAINITHPACHICKTPHDCEVNSQNYVDCRKIHGKV